MLKELFDAIMRVAFGHNAVNDVEGWKESRDKATGSRAEVEKIIEEAENE